MESFAKHAHLGIPAWNATIWRYMGIAKFLDFALNKQLLFVSPSQFTDGYEVTLPPNIVKLMSAMKRGEIVDPNVRDVLSGFEQNGGLERDRALVNCWAIRPTESYAHWKIYLGGDKAGVAIKTNFQNLKKSIKSDKRIYAGKVNYSDSLPISKLSAESIITTKRTYYQYEDELRLFMLYPDKTLKNESMKEALIPSYYAPVNLDILVEEIVVSPFVASWFTDVFKETIRRIDPGLSEKVRPSAINDQ